MVNLFQKTWMEIDTDIAKRMAQLRKRRKISQKELAVRSGVSLGSLKRFEQSGEISLQSLTKLAIALEVEGELEDLFSEVPFASIEEVLNEQTE
jgi:hypothetical protein